MDGTLIFESNMDGVEIFVDGTSRGIVGKGATLRLPGMRPGSHTIQGVKMGYEPDGPRDEVVYPGRDSTVTIKILIARRRPKAAVDELNDGLAFYNKGFADNYKKAVEHFEKALQIDPTYSQAALYLGRAYQRNGRFRDRRGETLFIDARKMGTLVERVHRELSDDDVAKIAGTYHAWRGDKDAADYADVPGFCKGVQLDDLRKHGHVLTPGRYVGAEQIEDDGEPFEDKMRSLSDLLRSQTAEASKLDQTIAANLKELGYGE